jgi:hypothetical protein
MHAPSLLFCPLVDPRENGLAPRAATMRVLDLNGRQVQFKVKGDTQSLASVRRAGPCGFIVAQSVVDGGFAQIAVIAKRCGERVKLTLC